MITSGFGITIDLQKAARERWVARGEQEINKRLLHSHMVREWWRFWYSVDFDGLDIRVTDDAAWVWVGSELVAEFTPEQSPADITEILDQLKMEI
jgi:hypothetical protein